MECYAGTRRRPIIIRTTAPHNKYETSNFAMDGINNGLRAWMRFCPIWQRRLRSISLNPGSPAETWILTTPATNQSCFHTLVAGNHAEQGQGQGWTRLKVKDIELSSDISSFFLFRLKFCSCKINKSEQGFNFHIFRPAPLGFIDLDFQITIPYF